MAFTMPFLAVSRECEDVGIQIILQFLMAFKQQNCTTNTNREVTVSLKQLKTRSRNLFEEDDDDGGNNPSR